ncbi:unnamed protein product, partial [Effrenium voratum]
MAAGRRRLFADMTRGRLLEDTVLLRIEAELPAECPTAAELLNWGAVQRSPQEHAQYSALAVMCQERLLCAGRGARVSLGASGARVELADGACCEVPPAATAEGAVAVLKLPPGGEVLEIRYRTDESVEVRRASSKTVRRPDTSDWLHESGGWHINDNAANTAWNILSAPFTFARSTARSAEGDVLDAEVEVFGDEGDLDACAEALDQQRRQFEIEGKYEDAEQVKMRLELLQEKADAKRKEALRQRHLAQRLGVEEAHMKELQEFNQHWDQKVAEFEAHAASLQAQLQERHNQEFADARKKFETETEPRNPRFSKDLLNLRKIQDTLAKMKKYSEASKTKQQADLLEAKEREAWGAKRETKIRSLEEQFLHKQSLEMTGLTKRIVSGREEQKQARKLELQRLLQRYHN